MASIFRVHMLPAGHGDCLWIEYGDAASPSRVLIDGGPPRAWGALSAKLDALPEKKRRFELLVCTHVDADHISGVIKLLGENEHRAKYADVWFNGYKHLPSVSFGVVQGDRLSGILEARPWNAAFKGAAVMVPTRGPLMKARLPGGMKLTVLSPTFEGLENIGSKWESECREAGLDPANPRAPEEEPPASFAPPRALSFEAAAGADFSEDTAEANGSSIALLAEFDGRSVLFGADAFPSCLASAIERLNPVGGRLKVDAFKLPHHGSQNNTSRALIEMVDTPRYLISTSGSIFGHPDDEALARVIKYSRRKPTLIFNYESSHNDRWNDPALARQHSYRAVYPAKGESGIVVEL